MDDAFVYVSLIEASEIKNTKLDNNDPSVFKIIQDIFKLCNRT